jgi:hypothetical protein
MTAKVIWDVVKAPPTPASRSWRRMISGAPVPGCATSPELDQIQFLLGHVSIQTTERYLGCKQKLRCAVNDTMGLEPHAQA